MKVTSSFAGIVLAAAALLAGCDQISGRSDVAVLDLTAVAKATGQDEEIRKQAEAARADLGTRLQQLAANLNQQLQAERAKMGAKPSAGDEQRFQELTQQARQQINNAQSQAQNEVSQIEAQLVEAFRDKVDPLAEKIAREKGAKALFAADSYLFWNEAEIDITDEVIEAWRALPDEKPAADAAAVAAPAAAPDAAPATDAAADAAPAAAPDAAPAADAAKPAD